MSRETEAMDKIDRILTELEEDEGDKAIINRVLKWIAAKYSVSLGFSAEDQAERVGHRKPESLKRKKGFGSRKTGQVLTVDKMLVLSPTGKTSWIEFAREKSPKNAEKKGTVAVYYLSHILEEGNVTMNKVYTCFREASWRLPANLVNALHRTGTRGWIDTSNREDIKITPHGINLVERMLPEEAK